MLKNFIKIAWRNLMKNKTFTFINIFGLSFSVAFCLLLFLHIRHEQSYDTFHHDVNRLYRLESVDPFNPGEGNASTGFFSNLFKNDESRYNLEFSMQTMEDLKADFPEVEAITGYYPQGEKLIRADNKVFQLKNIFYTDADFFSVLNFPIILGNRTNLLSASNQVILSRSTAIKLFGDENPVGKPISMLGDKISSYTVSGIAEDAPENSSIQFDLLLPNRAIDRYIEYRNDPLNYNTHKVIMRLRKNVSAKKFTAALAPWVKSHLTDPFVEKYGKDLKDVDFSKMKSSIRPLAESHYNLSGGWGHYTDKKNIYQLVCLALIILFIAALNYVLLAVSNAVTRAQEVGLRKVMGAERKNIILQFWIEAQIIALLASVAGVLIAKISVPLFNYLINTQIRFAITDYSMVLLALAVISFVLGILSGFYPALFISKLKTASIIKSGQTLKVNPRFSRVLVILQYTICILFLVAALVINRQMNYISNKNLGFDKDQVFMVKNPNWIDFHFASQTANRLNDYVKSEPGILAFSFMNGGVDGSANSNGFMVNGERKSFHELQVGYDFDRVLGLQIVAGRNFSPDYPTDTMRDKKAAVINETFFHLLGDSVKLGAYCSQINRTVIGVVKDYHFASLTEKIGPESHTLSTGNIGNYLFKLKGGSVQQTIQRIESRWKSITGNYPFEFTFIDQTINRMYDAQMRWQKTVTVSCFFAVFIACMGLFGLSAINAINRTKEIGIRKVLGATVTQVVASLSKNFLVMVGIAILIALPVAWWMMNKWLDDFAYRIQLNGWILFAAALIAMLIALVAVGYQAVKAARANPVESLRSE